ncbi:Ras GTPase-activating protein, putative [Entamoeba histolytica HM-1:IMSS-B]|uniref:Ras GTPase-activating protein, putative n=5 Tax=Entamoeba histolytica TaxID=5759 RepID=C4M8S4_ENTH1|nr:Ras GTPase-activating protein, putative [Entamoeba histolytica HM-1:IMSS]EMD42695.1 Ras GTPase-activating protein, putative [Entamoeba histolytica KU27]EMH74133.1 Ras GTPase-activating protein, putative [Entamoeba histolytica HM-1:IMSS-B]ENY65232.1 Ras GTPase-activating protein, putative [Entamoeba histolytica HM-1:IMSS-A]GAT98020.1 Ras GTPase-activating protein putative [Entamoeba histolytica]EAL44334.1 Ras GTPase-activating protein, putative [Entamoeba histolytica HM-1:IMSS]|eukprot:XP_649720.1 Ras GTPase-activating protein, putative [Entamoeba histolytica HM-1:IMSS]
MSQDLTITFENNHFKDIYDHYASLVYRLMNDLEFTIYIGTNLPPELQDGFTKIIVDLLILHGRFIPCIEVMIKEEFDKSNSEGTLFRSNNLCSRMMTHFAKSSCRPFLRTTLKNVINEINVCPHLLEIDTQKDPSLTPQLIAKNTELLQAYTTKFIRSIESNLHNLPVQIIEICKQLYRHSQNKFPQSKLLPFTMVGGFLFLRVICPSLAAPEASGIEMTHPIQPNCRRNLILITKIIQNIANNVTSTKEPYFKQTIPFTIEMSAKLNNDIEMLCTKTSSNSPVSHTFKSFEDTDMNNLFELHSLLLKAKELQKEPTIERKEISKTMPAIPKNSIVKGRARATFVSFDKKPVEEQQTISPHVASPRESNQSKRSGGWFSASPRHEESQTPSSPRLKERKSPSSNSPQNIISPVIPIDCHYYDSSEDVISRPSSTKEIRLSHSESPGVSNFGCIPERNKSSGSLQSNSPDVVLPINLSASPSNPPTTSPIKQSPTPNKLWTRTSASKRTISPRMNALDNKGRPKEKEERKKLTPLELFWLLNEFADLLGPSPLIVEKKLGNRLNVDVSEDELGGMCEKIVEYLKIGKAVYIERAQDGAQVIYIIVNSLFQILEKDDTINRYFTNKWGDIAQLFLKEINGKYSILFDLTGVNYNLKEKFWYCFEQRNNVFDYKQRKMVKQVILFHMGKKAKKFITSVKALFETKALKKLIIVDSCVGLEELLGIDNVMLPEESIALDRREFKVTKINNKGKSQERILRLTLASLCNIDPITGIMKNTINLEQIEKIEITTISLMMDIRFRDKGKLESRLYQFSSRALMEKVMYEMYVIFFIRKGRTSTHFSYNVKKNGADIGKPLSFAKSILKKDCQMMITLKSIMIIDMMRITDIEISSLIEIKKDFEGKVYIAWKDTGNDCEFLTFDPFPNEDDFIEVVRSLMNSSKGKDKKQH